MDRGGHEVSHLSALEDELRLVFSLLTAKDEPELAAAEVVLLTPPPPLRYFVNTGVNAHNNSSRAACAHGHADTGLNATRAAELGAYFPSSSYSWYSSVKRVEVATVAMVTEGEAEPGRASRLSGRLAQVSEELVKVEKRGARAQRGRGRAVL